MQIRSRWYNQVLFRADVPTIRQAVEAAVRGGADLGGADLYGANLRGINLRGHALRGIEWTLTDLRESDLRGSDLSGSDLTRANLRRSRLAGTLLTRTVLTGAVLTAAQLREADLTPIRQDLWAVLDTAPAEVPALRQALVEGRIDGSTYQGACACLVGTLANARHCASTEIPGLTPDRYRPAERWFLAIRPRDTPATSAIVHITLEWLDAWTAAQMTYV